MKVKHNEEAPRLLRSIRESSLKKRRVLSHLEKFPWARALRTRAVLRSGEVLSNPPVPARVTAPPRTLHLTSRSHPIVALDKALTKHFTPFYL